MCLIVHMYVLNVRIEPVEGRFFVQCSAEHNTVDNRFVLSLLLLIHLRLLHAKTCT